MPVLQPGFAEEVYEIVAQIPAGKVATYGQIAEMLGQPRASREVGTAMANAGGRNLPCHRVVNRTGVLAPDYAFGGPEKQRALLEAEGITFLPDGTIDVPRHQWGEFEQLSFG